MNNFLMQIIRFSAVVLYYTKKISIYRDFYIVQSKKIAEKWNICNEKNIESQKTLGAIRFLKTFFSAPSNPVKIPSIGFEFLIESCLACCAQKYKNQVVSLLLHWSQKILARSHFFHLSFHRFFQISQKQLRITKCFLYHMYKQIFNFAKTKRHGYSL